MLIAVLNSASWPGEKAVPRDIVAVPFIAVAPSHLGHCYLALPQQKKARVRVAFCCGKDFLGKELLYVFTTNIQEVNIFR